MNTNRWEPGALNADRVTDCISGRIWGLEEHRLVKGRQAYGEPEEARQLGSFVGCLTADIGDMIGCCPAI